MTFIKPNENKLSHRWRKRARQNQTCFMNQMWTSRRPAVGWRDWSGVVEHESILTLLLDADIAQTNSQTSTDGIEFMESALNALIVAVRTIRDQADSVVKAVDRRHEQRSLSWKRPRCNHVKHFTRPVPSEVVSPCPNWKSDGFQKMLVSRMSGRLFAVMQLLRKESEPSNLSASFTSLRVEKEDKKASEGTNVSS